MEHQAGKMRPWFLLTGIAITPLALLLAWISMGLGHGSYFWTRALYPFASLLLARVDETAAYAHLSVSMLAILQFPAYGLILDYSAHKGHLLRVGIVILAAHSIAVALCFLGFFPVS